MKGAMSTYEPAQTTTGGSPSPKVRLGSIVSVVVLTAVLLAGGGGLWPLSAQAAQEVHEAPSPESSASPAATAPPATSPSPQAPVPSTLPDLVAPTPAVAASPAAAELEMSNGYAKPEGPGTEMGAAGKSASIGTPNETRSLPRAQTLGQDGVSVRAIQPDGTQGLPLGMDVSGWQPTVDWAAAWANGARFAYIKASEGPWTMNDYFARQYNGAAAVGMVRGAYHFARPHMSGGKNQAEVFIQSGGGWSADGKTLPGVLDLEAHVPVSDADTVGECYGMTPTQLVAWTRDFTSTYKKITSRDAVIYSSYSFWQSCMGNTTEFSATNPLWIAAYGPPMSGVLMPGGWSAFTFWQYADAGTFPGDQNVFNGSYDQLKTFVGGREVPIEVTVNDVVAGKDFDGDGVPDVIATKSDGTLWFYPGNGSGAFGAGRKIGSGWNIYDLVVGVGDFNKDGKNDLVARKTDGSLWFYAGTGVVNNTSEGYRGGVKVGEFGWGVFAQILGVGDFDSDGNPDLVATRTDGTLWFYPGSVTGRPGGGRQIGTGWNMYDQLVAPGDFDLDGKADIIARKPDGSLWHYAGTGVVNGSSEGYRGATKIGDFGWSAFSQIVGAGDANKDGKNDLMTRSPDGALWFYPGYVERNTGYGSAIKVGTL